MAEMTSDQVVSLLCQAENVRAQVGRVVLASQRTKRASAKRGLLELAGRLVKEHAELVDELRASEIEASSKG